MYAECLNRNRQYPICRQLSKYGKGLVPDYQIQSATAYKKEMSIAIENEKNVGTMF